MPQRLLRPSIRQSKRWNRLSYFEQSLYIRLITLVDDFARYEADPELIRSEAFPYGDPEGNVVQVTAVDSACQQLTAKDMMVIYEVGGVKYLQLTRWKERVRADESKYPGPECGQMTANDSRCQQMFASPPSPSPTPSPGHAAGRTLPEWEHAEKWLVDWRKNGADYTKKETKSAFLALNASGWMWGRNPIADPRSALERQIQTDRTKNGHKDSKEKDGNL